MHKKHEISLVILKKYRINNYILGNDNIFINGKFMKCLKNNLESLNTLFFLIYLCLQESLDLIHWLLLSMSHCHYN